MITIPANDLKTQGVSVLEKFLKHESEVAISVRGEPRYVIMPIETYQHIRELELQAAIEQTHQDIKQGRFHTSIKKHLNEIRPQKKKA